MKLLQVLSILARIGKNKSEIKEYIQKELKYNFSKTCDKIRPHYVFDSTCQGTCPPPPVITAFFEGENFEEVIRNAVPLDSDIDTLIAISANIAEAFFGIPYFFKAKVLELTNDDIHAVMKEFDKFTISRCFEGNILV